LKQLVECRSRTADKLVVLAECKPRPADKLEGLAERKSRVADKIFYELLDAAIDCSAKDSGSDFYRGIAHENLLTDQEPLKRFFGNCRLQQLTALLKIHALLIYGKTPQIPSVSVFCNPRTVDLTCTFQEQLIVGKNRILAARNKNCISQAAQIFLSC
jgi:hypothetical protein